MFPKVDEHVAPGWKYEGYQPIFQGDNAGPHIDSAFFNFVTSTCSAKGSVNNLDLTIFPTLSKQHNAILAR